MHRPRRCFVQQSRSNPPWILQRHSDLWPNDGTGGRQVSIVEIGGANSCFLDAVLEQVRPKSYDVIDTNEYGLSLLAGRAPKGGVVRLHLRNVLSLTHDCEADLVYCIGLMEHFDPPETRRAVLGHLDPLRAGGIAIISFLTPTLLCRLSRKFIKAIGLWKFPDERPLEPAEVLPTIRERADILYRKTLWLAPHADAALRGGKEAVIRLQPFWFAPMSGTSAE